MYYIFEDRKISDTSMIFRYAYPEKISEKFIYSDGVGGIQRKIEELVSKVSKPDF